MKIAKKITVKAVVGDVKRHVIKLADSEGVVADGQTIPLLRVVGKCNRYEVKTNDYGDSVCLKGQFEATNLETGEATRAPSCYLPEIAADSVAGLLQGEIESVDFAYDISIRTDADAITGYVYECVPLIEPQEDDVMTRLSKSLPKALAAPKKSAKAKS